MSRLYAAQYSAERVEADHLGDLAPAQAALAHGGHHDRGNERDGTPHETEAGQPPEIGPTCTLESVR